jgi:hypothetical protein
VNVIRIHSSAISAEPSSGSQARRPKAYQFAQAKTEPHQLRSVPVLATPAIPVSRWPSRVPSTTFATVDPSPFAYVSARSTSSQRGAR